MVHPTMNGDTPHLFKLINISTILPYFLDSQTFNISNKVFHTHA